MPRETDANGIPLSKWSSIERAKEYILAHKDESKEEQSLGSGLSDRTISRARAELIYEKKLAPSRKNKPKIKKVVKFVHVEQAAPVPKSPSPAEPAPPSSGSLLDSEAMKALSDLIDEAAEESDDAVVHKRLLKQCLMFAFDTRLHPDTRMSASQMWSKLKDQTKARELGPGKPKTRTEAIKRVSDILTAVGPEITMSAVEMSFNVIQKEPTDAGEVPTDTPEVTQAPPTTPTASGSEPPLPEAS